MTIKRFREAIDPSELIPDAENPNKGSEQGVNVLRRSLEETGPGKAPVIDAAGRIVAGNKTVEMAVELGIPIDIVQSYGDALIVHQRLDLDLSKEDGQARRMSLYDNIATNQREWEAEMLAKHHEAGAIDLMQHFRADQLRTMGIEIDDEMPNPLGKPKASYKPGSPESYFEDGAAVMTFPGQTFKLGNHRLTLGDDLLPGEGGVMIRAWENYTGQKAELEEREDNNG